MAKTAEDLVRAAKAESIEIAVVDAKGLGDTRTVFINFREPPKWKEGTIPKALCIPRGVLEWRAAPEDSLKDKSVPVIVYCKSDRRSALAAQTLQQLGFDDVKSLAGDEAWTGKQS